uniref:TetR/AcrR family transcriptional regulator n=1 Tax=Paraconexibacter sp. TaxID=2949640 RepID=UPI003568E293
MSSVTRKSGGRRKARREAIVTDMLRVVEELMEDGASFADITVEQLITEAGISRSTFYVYFEDKGVLLLALAEDVVGRLIDAARVWWELPPDGTRADVESALRGIADVYAQHASIWSALVDTSAYDPNVRASFRGVVALAIEGVSRHIREGQKAGTVRAGLDPKRTAAWLT